MRLKFSLDRAAVVEELPVTWSWGENEPPETLTPEEAKMIILFEIAESLKKLEFPEGPPEPDNFSV